MKLYFFSLYQTITSILFRSKEFAASLVGFSKRDLLKNAGSFLFLSLFSINFLLLCSSLILQLRGILYPVEFSEAFRQIPSVQMKGSLFVPWNLMLYFPLTWTVYITFSALIHFLPSWIFWRKSSSYVKSLVLMSYASLPLFLAGLSNNVLFDIWPATMTKEAEIFFSQTNMSVFSLIGAWFWKLWIVLSLRKTIFFSDDNNDLSTPPKESKPILEHDPSGKLIWPKQQFGFFLRSQASIVLFSFLSLTLTPTLSLFAQDVRMEHLNSEQYNSEAFRHTFNKADDLYSTESWDEDVKEAFRKRQITWERAIGMQMERQIEGVKNSDRIHMTSVYQDYLRRALETQKDELYQTNRFLSDVDINSKRNLFVDKLSQGIFALQKETSEYEIDPVEEQVVEIVEEPEPEKLRSDSLADLKDVYSQQKNKWEKGYLQSYQKGLREFSTALQSIQSGYDSFTKNLDEKDKEFQSHLKAINDYKKVVTKAIEETVNNLSDMLYYSDNKDLFRKKNSSEYNLAGQKLSDLISRMRSRLFAKDEDYSTLLTNLSREMTSYLEEQSNFTRGERDWREAAIYENHASGTTEVDSYDPNNFVPGSYIADAQLSVKEQYYDTQTDETLVANIKTFVDIYRVDPAGARASQAGQDLVTYINENYLAGSKTVSKLHFANLYTRTEVHERIGGGEIAAFKRTYNDAEIEENYFSHGKDFETYWEDAQYCIIKGCVTRWWEHRHNAMNYRLYYEVHDTEMQAEAATWAGFHNSISAEFSKWQEELLPAIDAWEKQAAAYKATYDSWKLQAGGLRDSAKENYEASKQTLQRSKTAWLSKMQSHKKDAVKRWAGIGSLLSEYTQSEQTHGEFQDLKELLQNRPKTSETLQIQAKTSAKRRFTKHLSELEGTTFEQTVYNKVTGIQDTISTSVAGVTVEKTDLAKIQKEIKLEQNLQRGLTGARQFALIHGTNLDLEQQEEAYYQTTINQYRYVIRDYYYVKDENGNRQYNEDGTAKLSLSASQLEKYQSGLCYTNPEACRIFMETTKEYKDIYVRDGKLVLVKDISNGVASKLAGEKQEGDIEHEGYVSGKQEQKIIVKLSRARRVAAPKGKDLFTTWSDRDMQSIQRASYNSSVAFQKDQVADSQRTTVEMQKAAKIEQYFQEAFYADVERLKKQEEMVQEITVAYLTGGAQGVKGKIKSMAQDRVNAAIEKATGLPLTFISGMTSGLSPKKALQNYTQELVTAHAAAATGWPQGFVSSLVSGSNMRDALNNYTKELVTSEIAKASGLPASAVSHFLSKVNKPKKRFLDNPNVKAVATVGAVVGGFMLGGPAGSAIALAVVNSAMAVAKASDKGQIKDLKSGATIVGGAALAGTVTVASGGMVSAEISYSEEDGFGAELSVGLNGIASTSMSVNEAGDVSLGISGGLEGIGKVGGELSFRQEEGFGAAVSLEGFEGVVSTGLGYTEKQGARATLGIADKSGATVGLEYSETSGFAGYAGTKEVKATYSDAKGAGLKTTVGGDKLKLNAEITQKGGFGGSVELQNENTSGRVGWNQQQGAHASVSHTEQFGNNNHHGSATGKVTISEKGGVYIDANGRYGNPGQVNIIKNLTDLENSTDAMIDKHRKDAKDAARIKNIQENLKKLGATPFSTEYLKTLKEEDIAKLSHDIESAAQAEGKKDEAHNTSRPEDQNWLQEAVQEFGDSLGVFSGKVADKDGWVDSLGRFHQRTCFVAGTLVHTKNGLKKIEEIQVGDIVLTKDENTGKSLYRKVTELFYHEVDTLFVLKLGNGETIQTTWNHPFWIENKGWTEAKDILPGNKLITPEGVLEVLSNHQKYVSDISVYNFEVEETHSYFVGEIGFWVHNYDLKNTIHYQTFITAGGKGNTETAKGAKKLNKEVDEYYRKKKEKFDEEHKALEEKIQAERGIDIVKGAEIYMKGKEHMYWEGGSTGADGKSIDCSSYMMRGLEISQYLKEFEYLDPRYFKNSPYFNKVNDQDVKAGDIRTAYFKDKKGKLHSHAYMYTGLKDEKLKILEFSPSSGYTRAGEDTTVNFHYDKDYLFTNSKKWKNQGAYRTKITKNYYIRKAEELDIKNRSRQEKHWKIFRKEHPNDSFDMEVDCRKRLYGHCRP